jgi:hypothetical protein
MAVEWAGDYRRKSAPRGFLSRLARALGLGVPPAPQAEGPSHRAALDALARNHRRYVQ